jgi:hypothetical protein
MDNHFQYLGSWVSKNDEDWKPTVTHCWYSVGDERWTSVDHQSPFLQHPSICDANVPAFPRVKWRCVPSSCFAMAFSTRWHALDGDHLSSSPLRDALLDGFWWVLGLCFLQPSSHCILRPTNISSVHLFALWYSRRFWAGCGKQPKRCELFPGIDSDYGDTVWSIGRTCKRQIGPSVFGYNLIGRCENLTCYCPTLSPSINLTGY